ncbi:MAG: hypothetical protein WBW48_07065 [Anaerolineae bacterium]
MIDEPTSQIRHQIPRPDPHICQRVYAEFKFLFDVGDPFSNAEHEEAIGRQGYVLILHRLK